MPQCASKKLKASQHRRDKMKSQSNILFTRSSIWNLLNKYLIQNSCNLVPIFLIIGRHSTRAVGAPVLSIHSRKVTSHLHHVRNLKSLDILLTHFHSVLLNYTPKKIMLHVRHPVVTHDNINTEQPWHNYLVMFFIILYYLATRFDHQTISKLKRRICKCAHI
jgi:hypothetical protein